MTKPCYSIRGFSIIELMVVVVIIGIFLLFAMPGFTQWMANTRVRTSAETIQNGLRLAASEAAKRNVQVEFVLTNDAVLTATPSALATGKSWVVRVAGATPELLNSSPQAEAASSIVINSTAATIGFTGLGRLAPGTAAVQIDFSAPQSNRPLRVIVSTGGRVRMCDPAFPNTDPQGC